MPAVQDIDGAVVRLWLRLAADELDRARAAIDILNVFPVPDADTGTNMARTISCAADAVAILPDQASAGDVWRAAADAALQGACGNSGIILSQLLCGLADTCGAASPCDGQVVALALSKAAALARAAVHRPVEGTVLTVADAAARAAVRTAAEPAELAEVGRAAALGAREALLGTQRQLEVLAASGVVDAGGAGLCVLLDALSAAIGGADRELFAVPAPSQHATIAAGAPESEFGYEVTFLLGAQEDAASALRDRLDLLGDSLVVSGRAPQWHVHVHVADAGAAVEAGLTAGQLSKITVTYLNRTQAAIPAVRPDPATAVVAIAEGAGLATLLRAAGATVVDGAQGAGLAAELDLLARSPGQTALDEFMESPGYAVLLTTRSQFAARWPHGWPVLETGSDVQLLAALAVHDPRRGADADLASMGRAIAGMRWASVRHCAPCADGSGQPSAVAATWPFTGAVDGEDIVIGNNQEAVALAVTDLLIGDETEMLTLVIGRDAQPGLPALVTEHVARQDRQIEVVCYDGGMASSLLQIGAE
ncbi:MAG TPA: DAK2 domain-containing protein [Streptosporangiaceae bacterium]